MLAAPTTTARGDSPQDRRRRLNTARAIVGFLEEAGSLRRGNSSPRASWRRGAGRLARRAHEGYVARRRRCRSVGGGAVVAFVAEAGIRREEGASPTTSLFCCRDRVDVIARSSADEWLRPGLFAELYVLAADIAAELAARLDELSTGMISSISWRTVSSASAPRCRTLFSSTWAGSRRAAGDIPRGHHSMPHKARPSSRAGRSRAEGLLLAGDCHRPATGGGIVDRGRRRDRRRRPQAQRAENCSQEAAHVGGAVGATRAVVEHLGYVLAVLGPDRPDRKDGVAGSTSRSVSSAIQHKVRHAKPTTSSSPSTRTRTPCRVLRPRRPRIAGKRPRGSPEATELVISRRNSRPSGHPDFHAAGCPAAELMANRPTRRTSASRSACSSSAPGRPSRARPASASCCRRHRKSANRGSAMCRSPLKKNRQPGHISSRRRRRPRALRSSASMEDLRRRADGPQRVRLRAHGPECTAHPAAASDAPPRQLGVLALAPRPLARRRVRRARRRPPDDDCSSHPGRVVGVPYGGDKGRGHDGEPLF